MYAIIFTGGKQYRVEVGEEVSVEKLDAKVGDSVKVQCLAVFDGKGAVTGKDAQAKTVTAKVIEHGLGQKLDIFKYKPKKNERKRMGHRQPYTKIKITSI